MDVLETLNSFDFSKKMVYVAGPISADIIHNTRNAIDVWKVLMYEGYIPIVPHLSILIELVYPIRDEWYKYDLHLLYRCDMMLRLPGASFGADLEEAFAKEHGIPVYYTVEELIENEK